MNGNGHRAAIGMVPPLVASGLPLFLESQFLGNALEFARVALGMNDFGIVGGKRDSLFAVFFRDHVENAA